MRDIVEHGCPLWESVVADEGRPWSPYVTAEQRLLLHTIVEDVAGEKPKRSLASPDGR